jgi:hypothetical protein
VPLPPGVVVFKFYPVPEVTPEEPTPNELAFRPSDNDVADAMKKGHPIRLSVWDWTRTSVPQARVFRNVARAQDAWALKVSDVVVIAEEFEAERFRFQIEPLQVVEDPDLELQGPGADGHCGVEGLGADKTKKKRAKDFFHRLRLALASKAERIQETV